MKFLNSVLCILISLNALGYAANSGDSSQSAPGDTALKVDFAYAFAPPHRLTVSLPGGSDKTLVDVYPDYIRYESGPMRICLQNP